MRLAAVVITRNEEANIARCLESVRFCDEIIVVDSGSTDRTVEIAKRYTDRVVFHAWRGYSAQKNYANSLTECEWILSVDADEEVSDELAAEIKRTLALDPTAAAFSIPRKTIHMGRWIRHGGWYPNRLVRLFAREQGAWVGDELHEKWITSGNVLELHEHLNHYSFTDIADQVERNNRYSSLGAMKLRREGQDFSVWRLFLKTVSKFLETYVVKRGFLDGYPGFIISISAAYSVFLKWAKLWELENNDGRAAP